MKDEGIPLPHPILSYHQGRHAMAISPKRSAFRWAQWIRLRPTPSI